MSNPVLVGHANHSTISNATTNAVSYTVHGAGNSLIVLSNNSGTPGSASLSSDSLGNSFSTDFPFASGIGNAYLSVFHADNVTAGSDTITVTYGAACASTIYVLEVSGLRSVASFDSVSTINGGTNTTVTSNAATPGVTGDYAVFFVGTTSTSALTYSSFTSGFVQEDSASSGLKGTWADQVLTGTTSISGGVTLSASATWSSIVLLYKAVISNQAMSTVTSGALASRF